MNEKINPIKEYFKDKGFDNDYFIKEEKFNYFSYITNSIGIFITLYAFIIFSNFLFLLSGSVIFNYTFILGELIPLFINLVLSFYYALGLTLWIILDKDHKENYIVIIDKPLYKIRKV